MSKFVRPVSAQELHLSDLRGRHRATLILFWGLWCPFCREIIVQLTARYPELRARDMAVIAVSMRESSAKVALFIDKLKPGFPVVIDEWGSLKERYAIRDVPLAVILDGDQVVQTAVITTSAEKVQTLIDQTLAADAPEADTTN
jgi:peroxiredoxin